MLRHAFRADDGPGHSARLRAVHTAAQAAGLEQVVAPAAPPARRPAGAPRQGADAARQPTAEQALATLLVHILRMPPASRTRAQLHIVAAFLEVCPRPRGSAFARIAAAVKMIGDLMLLAAEAHCLVVSGGAQLYLQGEAASTSFIVLQGSIHIYARDAASQAIVDDQRARRAADGKDGWDLLVPHGEKVAELVEGACFGASGLLDAAAPAVRRDTAIVESGSATLLVLDYGSVRALFGLDAETRRRVTVLGRSALFAEWPRMQLARLASVATVATFGNGSFVVRSGDGADTLYFIESGVVIERAVAKHATHGRVGRGDAGGVVAAADSGGTSGGRPSHAGGAGGHASGSGGGGGAGTSGASGHPQDWPVDISMYVESDIIGERPLFFDVYTHSTDLVARGDVTTLVFSRDALASFFGDGESAAGTGTLARLHVLAEAREMVRRGLLDMASAVAGPLVRITLTRAVMRTAGVVCGRCGRAGHFALDPTCVGLNREAALDASTMAAARVAAGVFSFREGDFMSPTERLGGGEDYGTLMASARAAAASGRMHRNSRGGASAKSGHPASLVATLGLKNFSRKLRSRALAAPALPSLMRAPKFSAAGALPPVASPEQLLAASRARMLAARLGGGAGACALEPHSGADEGSTGALHQAEPRSLLFADASKSSLTIAGMMMRSHASRAALMRLDSAIFSASGRRVAATRPPPGRSRRRRRKKRGTGGATHSSSGDGGGDDGARRDVPRLPGLVTTRVKSEDAEESFSARMPHEPQGPSNRVAFATARF